jgi:hypothetical protein
MNLLHEKIEALCEKLQLPGVLANYLKLRQLGFYEIVL